MECDTEVEFVDHCGLKQLAKSVSLEATHDGTAWDSLFYKTPQPDTVRFLPVIAVSTTSGKGPEVTQVYENSNTSEHNKSALFNNIFYPQVCIVDPELMVSVPEYVTASTVFDVFCHSFESTINPGTVACVDLLAWEAITLVVENMPKVLTDLTDIEAREKMTWVDFVAGLCIANAGVTLPHGIGLAIGGMLTHVAHGEALDIVYSTGSTEYGLPDYKGKPGVATEQEMIELISHCYSQEYETHKI